MPLGLLGLFPLHAAGHPGEAGALDRVVSSYTSTLRVLAHTRGRPPAATRRQLVIALEHTPGLPDLPNTVTEAVGLDTGTPPLVDHDAITEGVLTALAEPPGPTSPAMPARTPPHPRAVDCAYTTERCRYRRSAGSGSPTRNWPTFPRAPQPTMGYDTRTSPSTSPRRSNWPDSAT